MEIKICAFCHVQAEAQGKEDKNPACMTAKPGKRTGHIRTILIPAPHSMRGLLRMVETS
jgi:hypothetical protein